MRVLVIGANGKTGQRIVRQMKDGPHIPVAMVRDPAQQAGFTALDVESVIADLEEDIGEVLDGIEGVIFAAGSGSKTGPEKTISVDRDGAIRSIDRAREAGVRRYVMLSSMHADPGSEGREISHYYRAKGIADEHLRRQGPEHVIVRPGRLTDELGEGRVRVAPALPGRGEVPRDDVAAVLIRCLDHPGVSGLTFDLLEGDVPIQAALDRLAAEPPDRSATGAKDGDED